MLNSGRAIGHFVKNCKVRYLELKSEIIQKTDSDFG